MCRPGGLPLAVAEQWPGAVPGWDFVLTEGASWPLEDLNCRGQRATAATPAHQSERACCRSPPEAFHRYCRARGGAARRGSSAADWGRRGRVASVPAAGAVCNGPGVAILWRMPGSAKRGAQVRGLVQPILLQLYIEFRAGLNTLALQSCPRSPRRIPVARLWLKTEVRWKASELLVLRLHWRLAITARAEVLARLL